MSSSSSKENNRSVMSVARTAADSGDVFGVSAAPDMMLSPPPEEELRYTRRPTHEPSSASRPLANSMRPNQQSPTAYQTSKRKRTITGASARDSSSAQQSQQEGASIVQHTPNPRVRKQVRHVEASPIAAHITSSIASLGSPSSRRSPQVQPDAPMTPTRKGKGRGPSTELGPRSPYASNPNADYIPLEHLVVSPQGTNVRRRSVTPIPPYEPPKERYTPPREIVVSPPAGAERKPVRRESGKKKRVSVKTEKPPVHLWIKTEPPEIDLTTPAPPASPSEDPILLVGPPAIKVQRPSLPSSDAHDVSLVDFEMDLDLSETRNRASSLLNQRPLATPARTGSSIPPSFDFSNVNDDEHMGLDNDGGDTSSDVDFGTVADDGLFANVNDDGWSDSDGDNNDVEEGTSIGEGDFTGKFLAFKAPLKDPPTGESGDRMEEWARPISPHPKKLAITEPKEEDEDVDLGAISVQPVSETTGLNKSSAIRVGSESEDEYQADERPGYSDRQGRRLTLSEMEAMKFGPRPPTPKPGSSSRGESSHVVGSDESDGENDESIDANKNTFGRQESHSGLANPKQMDINDQNTLLDKFNFLDVSSERRSNNAYALNNSHRQQSAVVEAVILPPRSVSEHSSGESSQSTLNNTEDARSVCQEHVQDYGQEPRCPNLAKEATQEGLMKDGSISPRGTPPPDGDLSDCDTEVITDEETGDDSGDGTVDLSVVKIMSDDPMAAARAAAILKMHDYDMVARKLRRRRTTAGGVSKTYNTPKNMQLWRRRTVAGLSVEDALSANVSLPELLERAEEELRSTPARSRSGSVAFSSVGSPQKSRDRDFLYEDADTPVTREWTKEDWKLLDSCFTDERYDLGEQQGLEPGCLADVDDVPLESVVERFVELMGGAETVDSHGEYWTKEKLMSRTYALCKKQRSGNVAPPTPDVSARFSTPSRFSALSPSSSMIVPDFTPLAVERTRLFDCGSVSRKARLPSPSSESFFRGSSVPARHSRLRDQMTSERMSETPRSGRALGLFGFATPKVNEREDSDDESVAQEVETLLTPVTASRMQHARPESAVKRSLSYITSWLKPDMYRSKSEERKGSQLPGLPVPPSDVLSRPRGPVETPVPKLASKAVPPKDMVSLEHVPPPQPSRLPRRSKPRRLVDLNHVPTPQPKEEVKRTIPRRSSSSSVKDLVKEFEQKEKGKVQALPPRVAELRRQASVGSLKAKGKPTWRP